MVERDDESLYISEVDSKVGVPVLEESTPTAEEYKSEKPMDGEEETAGATVTLEEAKQQGEEITESILEVTPADKDEPAKAEITESEEIHVGVKDPKAEDTESYIAEQHDESLYIGEVDLRVGASVGVKILDKLSSYLASTSDIKLVHTIGSVKEGTIITIVLGKPVRLLEILSSKIPEAEITDGYTLAENMNRKVRTININ